MTARAANGQLGDPAGSWRTMALALAALFGA
jgi:hypothetical protein